MPQVVRDCTERYKNDLGGLNVPIDKSSERFIGQCGLLVQKIDGKEELENRVFNPA